MEPRAEIKNNTPAMKSEFLRPRRVARKPDKAEPMIHPMSADDDVKPCQPSVLEIARFHEKRLETLFGTRDDCGVIAEEKSSQYGYQYNTIKIGFIARFVLFHYVIILVLFVKRLQK